MPASGADEADSPSEDGPGQHNPDRSEAPGVEQLGLAPRSAFPRIVPDTERGVHGEAVGTKDEGKPVRREGLMSDIPALKPYRGKPAVRNFRGGDGNVGIIRSPVRAIALPDNRHEAEDEKAYE